VALEVANALQMNVRRGRHGAAFRDEALSNLAWLPMKVDERAEPETWLAALVMAERYGLTVYDASYLEIAARRKIPLATLDRQLRNAAGDEEIEFLGM
jgi:predicted nucleic acid-binding protein